MIHCGTLHQERTRDVDKGHDVGGEPVSLKWCRFSNLSEALSKNKLSRTTQAKHTSYATREIVFSCSLQMPPSARTARGPRVLPRVSWPPEGPRNRPTTVRRHAHVILLELQGTPELLAKFLRKFDEFDKFDDFALFFIRHAIQSS